MHSQGCTPTAAVALGAAAKIGTSMHRPFQAYLVQIANPCCSVLRSALAS